MTNAEVELNLADGLLGFLEGLTAQLLQYNRSPVPSRRLEQLQALCWDLEGLFASCDMAGAQLGLAAAEDWVVAFQTYARASDHACEAVKAVGWLWARGVTDDHADTTGDALRALQEAAAELLSRTIALAQVGEQMASDASSEAASVRPDLAQRFAAVRAGCARAGVRLRTGRLGFGAGAGGGEC